MFSKASTERSQKKQFENRSRSVSSGIGDWSGGLKLSFPEHFQNREVARLNRRLVIGILI